MHLPFFFFPQISIEISICKNLGKVPAALHWTDATLGPIITPVLAAQPPSL